MTNAMKKLALGMVLIFGLMTGAWVLNANASSFVQIKNGRFFRDGKPYLFMGANFWQAMNLGTTAKNGDRNLLLRELDAMKKAGITQLRILALSEGPGSEPYRISPAVQTNPIQLNESLLVGLDFALSEMKKRDMTAVVCLSNFWPWSGGFAQWVSWAEGSSIPYPPPHPGGSWSVFQEYASRFYALPKAVKWQQDSVQKVVSRINTITKIPYSEDPTILAWELANEPRGGKYRREFLSWIRSSARLIRSLDRQHLVTIGSEGETLNPQDAGNDFVEDHAIPEIDYATIHVWVENWGVYQPLDPSGTYSKSVEIMKSYVKDHVEKAKILKKPLILEEFGMARDLRSMDPRSSTTLRDDYYFQVFSEVLRFMKMDGLLSGVNFWAWSGESRPLKPYGGLWKKGDPFLGDPPHEEQGWYGVYSSDFSTLKMIESFSKKFETLSRK